MTDFVRVRFPTILESTAADDMLPKRCLMAAIIPRQPGHAFSDGVLGHAPFWGMVVRLGEVNLEEGYLNPSC